MFSNYKIDSWQKGLLYIVTLLVFSIIFYAGKKKLKFSIRVIIAMVIGVLVGFSFGPVTTFIASYDRSGNLVTNTETIIATIRPVGTLFLKLIQMVVIPLVLTSIIKSFTSLETTDKLKTMGFKTLFWLLITTTIGAVIGFVFATLFKLGSNFTLTGNYNRDVVPIENVILDFFPSNIFGALAGNVILPVITFGLFVSIAVIVENKKHKEKTKSFIDFIHSLNAIIIRITKFVIRLTPYAVFTFIAYAVGRSNFETLKLLGLYVLLIYGAMLFHFVVVQMGLLKLKGISPIQFIKKFSPAMFLAFTTQSSYGTLPVTMESLTKRVGVSPRVTNFVSPLSANVGMNACGGIFPAMVAVLTANAMGQPLTAVQFVLLLVVTTISAIGIAGVPGIATIAATVVLSALNLDIAGIGIIIGIDALIDMGRTMINVIGGGVAATIVAKSENELDFEMLNSKETPALT